MNNDIYELIDQYLQGTLPDDHPFVQRLKEDEGLAEEVEIRKLLPHAVVEFKLMQVEKMIALRRSKFIAENSRNWNWLLVALPVLVAGMLAYFYISPSEKLKLIPTKEPGRTRPYFSPKETIHASREQGKELGKTKIEKSKKEDRILPETSALPAPGIASNIFIEKPFNSEAEVQQKVDTAAQKETSFMPANPCAEIRIKAFIEETRPCPGTSEGILKIKNIRGGKEPYLVALNKSHFQEKNFFEGLKEADYDIVVKDANGCENIIYEKYPLKSKNCIEFADQAFNPHVASWEVPNNQEKNGEIAIFDGNGERVFNRQFSKGEKLYWEGSNENGRILVPGMYIYTIKYNDGSMEQGRITIIY